MTFRKSYEPRETVKVLRREEDTTGLRERLSVTALVDGREVYYYRTFARSVRLPYRPREARGQLFDHSVYEAGRCLWSEEAPKHAYGLKSALYFAGVTHLKDPNSIVHPLDRRPNPEVSS